MQPIVNGLKREFSEQMAFEQHDANTETGQAALDAYGLRAHPSYVIVAPSGQVLWQFTGPLRIDALRQQICQYGGQC